VFILRRNWSQTSQSQVGEVVLRNDLLMNDSDIATRTDYYYDEWHDFLQYGGNSRQKY
jgi:hypothetical protein